MRHKLTYTHRWSRWEHKIFDNGTHLVRSGSDFKMLGYIKFWKKEDSRGRWDFEITRRYVVRSIPEHKPTLEMTEKTMNQVRNRMERPVGYTITALDARKSTLTLKESNFANFTCDLMRLYYQTDVALMTGGTIKGDQVHTPGMVRLKFITERQAFSPSLDSFSTANQPIQLAIRRSSCGDQSHRKGVADSSRKWRPRLSR